MAKVRVWYRTERKRWYASFMQAGKKVYKSFLKKNEAYKYKEYMEYQLNHEAWQGIKGLTWYTATENYLASKEHHIAKTTLQDIRNTFAAFATLVAPLQSDLICQTDIRAFISGRKKGCNRDGAYKIKPTNATINKDLRNLRAFYIWCVKSGHAQTPIEFKPLPVTIKAFIPPTREQLQAMFKKAQKLHYPLYVRMVIAMTTGLRRSAIERLHLNQICDDYIDVERRMLVTTETKTREQFVKHLGDNAMAVINKQIMSLPDGSDKLLIDKWGNECRRVFEKIRLKGIDFHAMRNIAVSILGDMGESAAVLQKKLGHKSFETTAKYYLGVSQETDKRTTKMLDDFLTATRQ